MKKLALTGIVLLVMNLISFAQENVNLNKFRQLKTELATPNVYRTASGAPGHEYWQQKANYIINVTLDDNKQQIFGEETITYFNQSPDALSYLWLQLDQNIRAQESVTKMIETGNLSNRASFAQIQRMENDFNGGFKIDFVKDKSGNDLPFTINKTMMRVDLPTALKTGNSFTLSIKWWYNINDREKDGGRSGYEYFEDDDNYLYAIAQFYPRMAVYNDVEGWQHKQFLGAGEFTLPFGDFEVNITVPADHIVGATGELENASKVLTSEQIKLFNKAKTSDKPVIIVSQSDAEKAEKNKSGEEKTWIYKATNVRDFAFASSRKFIWDAMGVQFGNRTVMAQSLYPKEGNPLWEKYSTRAVAHTLKTYSKYTFDYPYPAAISVNSTRGGGMEYPMICFNGGRPLRNGDYSERAKYSLISVIIHEVGHNYFPMIVNSDERQWTWMDEGINTFLEYLAEQEWERDYPSSAGQPYKIIPYMRGDKNRISPIMTNSESVRNLGYNAYYKPTTALNILRETVMGRELFDFAFKQYAQRWMFKHPTPEDFFRTMEDASAVDLDWFWRGWFYTTDNVDISLDKVSWMVIDTLSPNEIKLRQKKEANEIKSISDIRNKTAIKQTATEKDTATNDMYTNYDEYRATEDQMNAYHRFLEGLSDEEKQIWRGNYNFYQIDFKNVGGLVMPIILEFEFTDGSKEVVRIPAEIWKVNNYEVSKVFKFNKQVKNITLDPFLETADIDVNNNYWPPKIQPSRIELMKQRMGVSR